MSNQATCRAWRPARQVRTVHAAGLAALLWSPAIGLMLVSWFVLPALPGRGVPMHP